MKSIKRKKRQPVSRVTVTRPGSRRSAGSSIHKDTLFIALFIENLIASPDIGADFHLSKPKQSQALDCTLEGFGVETDDLLLIAGLWIDD
jgi:hypothetical protein